MSLTIHKDILQKLDNFYETKTIPNILFYGPNGSGKRTIVNHFVNQIYGYNKELLDFYVMHVNCSHSKGIKFIREELKFFAKSHIHSNGGVIFKTILLFNPDNLTMDAQSALRRCIELFNHNTRFFMILEDKSGIMRPILSRFCEIYVPEVIINNKPTHLYQYYHPNLFKRDTLLLRLKKEFLTNMGHELLDFVRFAHYLYEKGFSSMDLVKLLEDFSFSISEEDRYNILIHFSQMKKEIRNEEWLLFFLINSIYCSFSTAE
jgi:Cdc6-like AAA superfamily ATPase